MVACLIHVAEDSYTFFMSHSQPSRVAVRITGCSWVVVRI